MQEFAFAGAEIATGSAISAKMKEFERKTAKKSASDAQMNPKWATVTDTRAENRRNSEFCQKPDFGKTEKTQECQGGKPKKLDIHVKKWAKYLFLEI